MTSTKRILLIEDDVTMRSLLKTLLQLEKHEVSIINEFDEITIMSELTNLKPDIIIMDYKLRSLNGIELLNKIRLSETNRSIKILMTSGYDIRDECKQNQADGFLLKPYMPGDLLEWIATSIHQHQLIFNNPKYLDLIYCNALKLAA